MRVTKKKPGIRRDRIYALKDINGKVTNNMDEIVRISEHFYAKLYDSNARPENIPYRAYLVSVYVPVITVDENNKALKVMSRVKARGEDGITIDLLKDGADMY